MAHERKISDASGGEVARSNSLADLAPLIRAEHDAVRSHARATLEHALRAGELLLRAKDLAGHGYWSDWLHEHCDVSERTAQTYMRLARNRLAIESSNPQGTADLTIEHAVKSLAKPKPPGIEIEAEYAIVPSAADYLPADEWVRFGELESRGVLEWFAVVECDVAAGYFHVGHIEMFPGEDAGGNHCWSRKPMEGQGILPWIEHVIRDQNLIHKIEWRDISPERGRLSPLAKEWDVAATIIGGRRRLAGAAP